MFEVDRPQDRNHHDERADREQPGQLDFASKSGLQAPDVAHWKEKDNEIEGGIP